MRRLAVIAIATLAAGMGVAASAATATRHGRGAHTISGSAQAHLHYVRSSGSTLIEEGPVSGNALTGHMHAHLQLGATFTGTFIFFTRGGQIKGHGSAKPHGSGRFESFSGTVIVNGGTGRYVHAWGHAPMHGTFDRKTYNVTIHTGGTFHY
jgi:hypothetical protein